MQYSVPIVLDGVIIVEAESPEEAMAKVSFAAIQSGRNVDILSYELADEPTPL